MTTKENTALAVQDRANNTGSEVRPILPQDFDTGWRLAVAIAASGLTPKGMEKPESVFIAMQLGAEIGLSPMQSVQNVAVVNGRPTIWGDAQLAVVRASGQLEHIKEEFVGEWKGKKDTALTFKAVCTIKRKGYEEQVEEFSIQDALDAGLWGKVGPWSTNPKRMLKMRPRSFALRDQFTDILKGIYSTEEMMGVTPDDMLDVTNSASPAPEPKGANTVKEKMRGKAKPKVEDVVEQPKDEAKPTAEDKPDATKPDDAATQNDEQQPAAFYMVTTYINAEGEASQTRYNDVREAALAVYNVIKAAQALVKDGGLADAAGNLMKANEPFVKWLEENGQSNMANIIRALKA